MFLPLFENVLSKGVIFKKKDFFCGPSKKQGPWQHIQNDQVIGSVYYRKVGFLQYFSCYGIQTFQNRGILGKRVVPAPGIEPGPAG